MIEKFSGAEKQMFTALGFDPDVELVLISPMQLYNAAAIKCFLENRTGAAVESLRRCLNFLETGGMRRTPDFDELIKLEEVEETSNATIGYQIYKGNFPSLSHSIYKTLEEAQSEVDRINNLIIADNERIDKNPSTGHGSAFLNQKREPEYNVREKKMGD